MILPFARRRQAQHALPAQQWGSIADVMRAADAQAKNDWQLAVPQFAVDAVKAVDAVGSSGLLTPYTLSDEARESMTEHAGAIVGPQMAAGFMRNALLPRGASELGSSGGKVTPGLPMDFDSRMARAREMGFRMNPVYHGTATGPDGTIFSSFDPARTGGRTSGSRAGQEGVSVALNPEVANEYAMLAAQKSGGNPAVMPMLHRTESPAALRLDGTEKNLEVAATLNSAFQDGGRDAVALKNYTTPSGKSGETVVILREPSQLRSINAAFDPARRHEADLLAARGVGLQPVNMMDEQDILFGLLAP